MNNKQEISQENHESDFNIREQIEKYLVHWKWFLLSVIVVLGLAFLYLRYSTPLYKATATILVKDDKKGGLASELSVLSDLGVGTSKSNVDNEVEILKSRTLTEKTVSKLHLNIHYLSHGRVKSSELYKASPIVVVYSPANEQYKKEVHTFTIESVNANKFKLFKTEDKELGTFSYGSLIKIPEGTLSVTKVDIADKSSFSIDCNIYPVETMTTYYRGALGISPVGKNTSVIELSVVDQNSQRAADFLNTLVEIYNDDAIEDKNLVAEKTSQFISTRLGLITDELTDVEKDVEGFKKQNNLTDIPTEATMFLENASEYEKKQIETEIQLNVVASMRQFLNSSGPGDLIPSNLLSTQSEASELIMEYNRLVIEYNRIAAGATAENPVVVNAAKKIQAMKSNISQSLARMQSSLTITKKNLDQQGSVLGNKKAKVPRLEREFRIIDRQQKVKEALYLYLLQKREETALTLAATEQSAKVIDSSYFSGIPVSPKKSMIYLIALVIGLAIPAAIIYLQELLNTKIKSRLDIEKRLAIPFLGDVPKSDSHEEMINTNSRSGSAEAIRIVRTNLEFMLTGTSTERGKVIFVTSTIPGEGKTFISVNLAGTIALSGKKVLLVGMDIRNPKLAEYIPIRSEGVTNYLSKQDKDLSSYITRLDNFEDFHVLSSGVIPPNPVELLMNDKINKMFAELKETYDYIIVDTAPVSVVTDTLLIAKNADAFIYVVRANYLDKRLLHVPEMFYNQKKLPNMSLVLNATEVMNKGYGYGYGYGYGADVEVKPWYKTLFKK
ncbi:GumC family protein [Flavobacterium lindanitolerans]|uniref:non-specific protein-tyrosine kinase n=3 Tax=Flavobacterium lindanitolerans TaxID=428988 RepID=A0A497TX38_9FLAO|nr:tyrosine-protein kinase [Flavobacterium lindanitolerans]PKW20281.1 capsular exopolysaccharide synthesis family protein [Flavobacterium lindanitolerans]RLJ23761.1 capsular exopolysaccharide synthesis family protein [Flavobacterium lindanitolerans]